MQRVFHLTIITVSALLFMWLWYIFNLVSLSNSFSLSICQFCVCIARACYVKTINAECREHYFGFINKTLHSILNEIYNGGNVGKWAMAKSANHLIFYPKRMRMKRKRVIVTSKFRRRSHKHNRRFNRRGRTRVQWYYVLYSILFDSVLCSIFHFLHIIKFEIISCSFNELPSGWVILSTEMHSVPQPSRWHCYFARVLCCRCICYTFFKHTLSLHLDSCVLLYSAYLLSHSILFLYHSKFLFSLFLLFFFLCFFIVFLYILFVRSFDSFTLG